MKIPLNKFRYYSGARTFVALKSNLDEMPDRQFDIMIAGSMGHMKFFIEDEIWNMKEHKTVLWKYRSESNNWKTYIYNE